MSQLNNEKEVRRLLINSVDAILPELLKDKNINFRLGNIAKYNSNNNSADIQLSRQGDLLRNVPLQSGIRNVANGDTVILISLDPNYKSQIYGIVYNNNSANVRHTVRIYRETDISYATGTSNTVEFEIVEKNIGGLVDLEADNQKIIIKRAGDYFIQSFLAFTGVSASNRIIGQVRINGNLINHLNMNAAANASATKTCSISGEYEFKENDEVTLVARHDNGSNANLVQASLTVSEIL